MPCHLIIHDDYEHSIGYVIEMLTKTFEIDVDSAYVIAHQINSRKKVAIETANLLEAQALREQLFKFGPDLALLNSTQPLHITLDESLENASDVVGRVTDMGFITTGNIALEARKRKIFGGLALPGVRTPLFVNLLCCVAQILTAVSTRFIGDLAAQDVVSGFGKTAVIVLFIWSSILYFRAYKANPELVRFSNVVLVIVVLEFHFLGIYRFIAYFPHIFGFYFHVLAVRFHFPYFA